MHDLALRLLSDADRPAVDAFPTAALATLTFTGSWRSLAGRHTELVTFLKPRELD
jgi:phosphohistidine phosphatase SixA